MPDPANPGPNDTLERRGRVLHVAHLMTTFRVGGLERLVYALAKASVPLGVKTTVFAYDEDGELRGTFERAGVTAIFVPTPPGIRYGLGPKLAFELSARRVDVLHSHHLGPYMYGAVAARLAGVPHVTTEHSRELYDTPRRWWVGKTMAHAAEVVTVSHELAQWRRASFNDDPTVILNGVSLPPLLSVGERTERRRALGLPDGFLVACVARLAPEKDHATLLRAFARVRRRVANATLVLVGWGPLESEVEALGDELGIAEHVRFLGRRDDVEDILPACDVITLSSRREGLPLALLEGMAAGLPVVATSVGDVPTLVAEGEGFAVGAGDDEAFADALVHFASDPESRRRAGARARARVERVHSVGAMASSYLRTYQRVLSPATVKAHEARRDQLGPADTLRPDDSAAECGPGDTLDRASSSDTIERLGSRSAERLEV